MKKTRKPGGPISDARWARIRDDWLSTHDPVRAIADRHGIGNKTLYSYAARKNWPPRGSKADDPATIARLLYTDLTTELRASIRSLREADGEDKATAAQRAPLIRAHRRALITLLDARKPLKADTPPPASTDETFPALDLEAARTDILTRLARLDETPPPDLAG